MATQSMSGWDSALQGAAETLGGNTVGAITLARGCVSSSVDATTGMTVYTIAVAWQGQTDAFVPTAFPNTPVGAQNCAINLYSAETQRRVVWTTLEVANLQ